MVKITPDNITQEEILKLLEALVMLKEITDKIDLTKMRELNFLQRTLVKKYKQRIVKIYEDIDNKK